MLISMGLARMCPRASRLTRTRRLPRDQRRGEPEQRRGLQVDPQLRHAGQPSRPRDRRCISQPVTARPSAVETRMATRMASQSRAERVQLGHDADAGRHEQQREVPQQPGGGGRSASPGPPRAIRMASSSTRPEHRARQRDAEAARHHLAGELAQHQDRERAQQPLLQWHAELECRRRAWPGDPAPSCAEEAADSPSPRYWSRRVNSPGATEESCEARVCGADASWSGVGAATKPGGGRGGRRRRWRAGRNPAWGWR